MSGRPQRNRANLDYRELHNSGKLISKSTPNLTIEEGVLEISTLLHNVSLEDLPAKFEEISKMDTTQSQAGSLAFIQPNDQHPLDDTSNIMEMKQTTKALFSPVKLVNEIGETAKALSFEVASLGDEIEDFIDEKEIDETFTNERIDNLVNQLNLRCTFRNKFRELHAIIQDDTHIRACEEKLRSVKAYMKRAVDCQRTIQDCQQKAEHSKSKAQKQTNKFLTGELERICNSIRRKADVENIPSVSDQELKQRIESKKSLERELERVGKIIQEVIQRDPNVDLDDYRDGYNEVIDQVDNYKSVLASEFALRELDKEEKFPLRNLNIKLAKFKGYNSALDFYTFKSEFEKLHKKSTPDRLMPDLLKNNFLEGAALELVKGIDNLNEIWERLKEAYGDARTLIENKLAEFGSYTNLQKIRDPTKLIETLSKLINAIKDLIRLAKEHRIEKNLYYGDGLNKIFFIIGDERLNRWLKETYDDFLGEKESWESILKFLEKDLRIQQQKQMILKKFPTQRLQVHAACETKSDDSAKEQLQDANQLPDLKSYASKYSPNQRDSKKEQQQDKTSDSVPSTDSTTCHICGEEDHQTTPGPNGSKLVQYFSCKKFVMMKPEERYNELRRKNLCMQCLYPGAKQNRSKHRNGLCNKEFICKHESHKRFNQQKHILVCDQHKDSDENKALLETFKERFIQRYKHLPSYSKNIKLSFAGAACHKSETPSEPEDKAIYILQKIKINGKTYTIFFDSGCDTMVCKYDSIVELLGTRAKRECSQKIIVGGVADTQTVSDHGIYSVRLPLYNGDEATFIGACIDKVTTTLPTYELKEVERDIHQLYRASGKDPSHLPKLPESVGGEVDFMIGIKYLRYHPEIVYQLPSGLTIYKSPFRSSDGGRGVVGGPHPIFSAMNEQHESTDFISSQLRAYRVGYRLDLDIPMLTVKTTKDPFNNALTADHSCNNSVSRCQKTFERVEDEGSSISYRCMKCRKCNDCKADGAIEMTSIREEVEQDLINKSVVVDISKGVATARLPLIHDPATRLANNKNVAAAIYKQQLIKLNKAQSDKNDVIKSEKKLQDLGHVDFVRNLSPEQQHTLNDGVPQYFIPWRAVWKANSVSTPCRIVFDASQATSTGYSLNDVLAKGTNNMNKLQEIVIRWSAHHVAIHTDVTKMYNSIKLDERDWHLQKYLWQSNLDVDKPPEEKVIKTLIYGVKSSGNQSELGIRETANLSKDEFPEVSRIVNKDIYVDDCITGESTNDSALKRADELEQVLSRGGFALKGITFSGKPPLESLSEDGESILVAGMRWYPESDKLSLDVSELNFAKKVRGKKPQASGPRIPDKLTRRQCVAKVAEIYDLVGKITPITAAMKLDLREIVNRKLDWDDTIPDDLRGIWKTHFEMMEELPKIRFRRAVIPTDAVSMELDTIDTADASSTIACSAIYARFLNKNGEYLCQLVFSRSKLIPKDMSMPRAELFAAVMNAHTGEIVKRSFGNLHKSQMKLTDSQITLHWISSNDIPLKMWVRNRVLEIRRFTNVDDWKYVKSSDMIADKGTRKGATLSDIAIDSAWQQGYPWMRLPREDFPVVDVARLKMNQNELSAIQKESTIPTIVTTLATNVNKDETAKRYKLSKYLIDPNKHRFRDVVRILAICFKYLRKLKSKAEAQKLLESQGTIAATKKESTTLPANVSILITEEEIQAAEAYFFRKATKEVKVFTKESRIPKNTRERDGILYYTGRTLPTQEDSITIMKDLHCGTFIVPIIDEHSPVAYSIVNDVHWYHEEAKHAGVETVLRYTKSIAHIINGRDIVKRLKKNCQRCRYLHKKTVDVCMGPITPYQMKIAPPFYYTQCDLAGPFNAYSPLHKRTTIKIWLSVFCCITTSATVINVMDDYSATAFILSFTRFACEVGYPKKLFIDEGSQLKSATTSMKINFQDLQHKLHRDRHVECLTVPVGGHNMNGKVERKIKEVKLSLACNFPQHRFSVLQWETIGAQIANAINDRPIGIGNIVENCEFIDILTPNRLRMGRNNNRSPVHPLEVKFNVTRFLKENQAVFNAWFEAWLTTHLPKVIDQPKWFRSDEDIVNGTVVLFKKRDSCLSNTYQYGIVSSVSKSTDGKIRKVHVKYRNSTEDTFRETHRATRELVVIHPVGELSIMQELCEAATLTSPEKVTFGKSCSPGIEHLV